MNKFKRFERLEKFVLIGMVGVAGVLVAGTIAFRTFAAKEKVVKSLEVSPNAAKSLQLKLEALKRAEDDPKHKRGSSHMEVSETELESYLLYSLKEEIPAQIDSADVRVGPDIVALDTQITFSSNATGNPVMDALVGGTHNLFLKGKFIAQNSRGKFDLQDVRVDGIPVPNVLIQALLKKYVSPKYPQVDLNAPFDMPWAIEELKLEEGKAKVTY